MADADPQIDRIRPEPIAVNAIEPVAARSACARRRNWLRIVAMLSVPLLILAVGGYFWLTSGRYVSTDNAYVQQDMVSISARRDGPDRRGRRCSENQRVKAGDLLFRIDPAPYRIALAQADAAIAGAQVQVSTMSTDVGRHRRRHRRAREADIASPRRPMTARRR